MAKPKGHHNANTTNLYTTRLENGRGREVPKGASFWRKLLAIAGPGYLVAVGYIDPGNWAAD